MLPRLEADIKAALLSGDKETAAALKFLKNALMVASKDHGASFDDDGALTVLRKEYKKRLEAAELFEKGGNQLSADKERKEAELIKQYLPAELSDDAVLERLRAIVAEQQLDATPASMGRLMGAAKQAFGNEVDGARVAQLAGQLLKGEA